MGRLKDRLQKVGITIGEDLSDVCWYILDKVLALVGMPNVLDGDHYAEEAEIIALLKAMNLNILVIDVPFVGTGCILPEHRYLRSADLERACEDLGSFDAVLLYWGDSHYDLLKVTNATQGAQVRGFDLESEWAECKKDLRALASKAGVEQDQLRLLDVVQLELPEATKLPEVGQEGEGAAYQDTNPTGGDSQGVLSSDEDDPEEECCPEEIEVLKSKSWMTDQDAEEEKVLAVAALLRERPLMPSDPRDPTATRSWTAVDSGVRLPLAHCAFRGCAWTGDSYNTLRAHLCQDHLEALRIESQGEDPAEIMATYCAAIREREAMCMSLVGVSVDRRTIAMMQREVSSCTVHMLICFCCATKHIALGGEQGKSEIHLVACESLFQFGREALETNFGFERFSAVYGQGPAFEEQDDLKVGFVKQVKKLRLVSKNRKYSRGLVAKNERVDVEHCWRTRSGCAGSYSKMATG